MLNYYAHDDRISSGDGVIQLKNNKTKGKQYCIHVGERMVDRINQDQNFILISIHYVIAFSKRRRLSSTMFKQDLGFGKNQNINRIWDRRKWGK